MKKDRGIGIYQFEKNPDSLYRKRIEETWTNPELITFEEYCQIEPRARSLPNPESLGIRPMRSQPPRREPRKLETSRNVGFER